MWQKITDAIASPPPLAAAVIAGVGTAVSLLLTQHLIDNQAEQMITGLASIVIPAAFAIGASIAHGHKKQAAAQYELARAYDRATLSPPPAPVVHVHVDQPKPAAKSRATRSKGSVPAVK